MATTPIRDALTLLGADRSDTAALATVFEQLNGAQKIEITRGIETAELLLAPKGQEVYSLKKYLDEYLPAPARRRGKAELYDLASFLAFLGRWAGDHTVVYAQPDETEPELLAVINANPGNSTYTDAGWADHLAVYAPRVSAEWTAWLEQDGTQMTQADFAAFLEDRVADVVVANADDPALQAVAGLSGGSWASPSRLLELSRGMQVNVDVQVKEAVTLASGEISVLYNEAHRDGAGAPLKVPNLFAIQIPVFYAGVVYRIPAHLRYRVSGGRMSWWYKLVRPEKAFEDAFNELAASVRTESGVPVFLGSPEK
jgi:uncharacterized protein YfdQ (DUF2303 family)